MKFPRAKEKLTSNEIICLQLVWPRTWALLKESCALYALYCDQLMPVFYQWWTHVRRISREERQAQPSRPHFNLSALTNLFAKILRCLNYWTRFHATLETWWNCWTAKKTRKGSLWWWKTVEYEIKLCDTASRTRYDHCTGVDVLKINTKISVLLL